MDKLLLSIVVVSALCAVSSAERRYHFVYELKNMTEAQRHCREKYIDLVTTQGMENVKILNTTVDLTKLSCSRYRAFIGQYDDMYSWRWSLSNTVGSGEPNNIERDEYCMYVDWKWNDYPCNLTFKPVCFDVRGPNETFVLINTDMTWTKAQSYCREHHTDLAMVRNMAEHKMVKKLVLSEESWIGLYRDGWKWSDGSGSTFLNWEPGVFSETRMAANFSANGQWETLNCNVMSAFICYSEVASKQVLKVRLKRSSSVDLNDPVVMEDLLKQLKQRLKDQGLNDDIKLSWKKQSDGKVFHKEEKTKKKRGDEL